MSDWLFVLPPEGLEFAEQEQAMAGQVSADPTAAAITDDEAESFFAAAWVLRFMTAARQGFAAALAERPAGAWCRRGRT